MPFRRRASRAGAWVAAIAIALAPATSSQASVIVPATLDELAGEADLVIYARVAAVVPRQQPRTLRVERLVALDVLRALKGTPPDDLAFVLPGGAFGRYRTIVPGMPEIAEGDEAVIFLRLQPGAAAPQLVGFTQGLLRVRVDPASGGRSVVAPAVAGIDGPIVRGATDRGAQPLARIEARIAAAVLARLAPPNAVRGRR